MDYEAPLTERQTLWLTILPIPTAILSILGSSGIIFMILRTKRMSQWTPYTRLLLGMSICDIILSITAATGTFMRPEKTSYRVGASGNDATCTASGFFGQLSLSAILYNGMLSFYFLLSARFGWKNRRISRWVEPFMHLICIGFPLATATIGAVLGVFSEPSIGLGCQINDYPRNCGEGPGKTGELCLSIMFGWIYIGMPRILTGMAIILNNLVICVFVWRQAKPVRPKLSNADSSLPHQTSIMDDVSSSCPVSERHQSSRDLDRIPSMSSDSAISDLPDTSPMQEYQSRRLQLVRSQSFLFVGSYFLCNVWVGLLTLLESLSPTDADEHAMIQSSYWILVLYAIFVPMQGLFNMLVYIRPKYRKYRIHFPHESRIWALCLTFTGDDNIRFRVTRKQKHPCGLPQSQEEADSHGCSPTCVDDKPQPDEDVPQAPWLDNRFNHHPQSKSLSGNECMSPPNRFSQDVKSSQDDRNATLENQRISQEQKLQHPFQRARLCFESLRSSNLDVISEISELSTPEAFAIKSIVDRWEASPKVPSSAYPLKLSVPQRLQSLTEESVTTDSQTDTDMSTLSWRQSKASVDTPIRCPQRRTSPPPLVSEIS